MKQRLLADVLWEAANVYLAPSVTDFDKPPLEFSCNAAIAAEARGKNLHQVIYETHQGKRRSKAVAFLEQLGCSVADSIPWRELRLGPIQRQGIRYMWLLLAMHVAEDEGIEL